MTRLTTTAAFTAVTTVLILSPALAPAGPPARVPAAPASAAVVPGRARVVLTTLKGAEVPSEWPLGLALGVTAAQSVMGGAPDAVAYDVEPAWVFEAAWPVDGGAGLVISAGVEPVDVTIRVAVAKGDTVATLTKHVSFRAKAPVPAPGPPPAPAPAPTPAPAPADPDAGLTDLARQFKAALADNMPEHPAAKAELAAFAANYESLCGRIQAAAATPKEPALRTPDGIEAETARLNQAAVADRTPWLPAFEAFKAVFDNLDTAGRLSEPAHYVTAYTQLAAAMRSYLAQTK